MKTYEELAVLEQGDDGAIVTIRGEEGPFVLLSAKYLGHLATVLGRAEEKLESQRRSPFSEMRALDDLCSELRTLLNTYRDTCSKYGSPVPIGKALADIEREMDDLRKQLKRTRPD